MAFPCGTQRLPERQNFTFLARCIFLVLNHVLSLTVLTKPVVFICHRLIVRVLTHLCCVSDLVFENLQRIRVVVGDYWRRIRTFAAAMINLAIEVKL